MKRDITSIALRDDRVDRRGKAVTGIGILVALAGIGICCSARQWYSPKAIEEGIRKGEIVFNEEVEI